MNILFLTYGNICDINERGIYTDLLRCILIENSLYTISPKYVNVENVHNDRLHQVFLDFNTERAGRNLLKKGISTLLTDRIYLNAFKKYFNDVKFDLVIYTTPPITITSTISYIKGKCNAKTYLLLKDIFPQNAVDLGMMTTSGLKSVLYKFFRLKEKKLYAVSDKIGCMSPANVKYVLNHNPEVDSNKVEVSPNSIEVMDKSIDEEKRNCIRTKYGIPLDKVVFVYGGNLGKPQGIPFLIECLKAQHNEKAYFLIVGDGSEYSNLVAFMNEYNPINMTLMKRLPKEDYDTLVAACDVGMIILDHRFTIPNYPSRLLSYMQAKLPVLASTDPNTDIGQIIEDGGFGWWCESDNCECFNSLIDSIISLSKYDYMLLSNQSYDYLINNYNVERTYNNICS